METPIVMGMHKGAKMGLLETEITELRQLVTDVMEDKVSMEKAAMQISIYSQVAKRERLMFDIWKTASKQKGIFRNAKNKNLLDNTGAIECISSDSPKLVCTARGGTLVTHEECLEYSGNERNIDECQGCDSFSVTRKRLLNDIHTS